MKHKASITLDADLVNLVKSMPDTSTSEYITRVLLAKLQRDVAPPPSNWKEALITKLSAEKYFKENKDGRDGFLLGSNCAKKGDISLDFISQSDSITMGRIE